MNGGARAKHHIDIMFLMVLFLIFTFSAISVLLLSVDSYKSIISSSESNASARTASAYVREVCHQHNTKDSISLIKMGDSAEFNGIQIDEGEGYYLYIYYYDGALRELNATADSGAGPEMGDAIMEIESMTVSALDTENAIEVVTVDSYGNTQVADICLNSEVAADGD